MKKILQLFLFIFNFLNKLKKILKRDLLKVLIKKYNDDYFIEKLWRLVEIISCALSIKHNLFVLS